MPTKITFVSLSYDSCLLKKKCVSNNITFPSIGLFSQRLHVWELLGFSLLYSKALTLLFKVP